MTSGMVGMTSRDKSSADSERQSIPRHIAIIMDGNGRWATKRFLPRVAGHVKGVEAVRKTVEACVTRGVEYLTVFAFSSENWRRPADEVSFLMGLFISALEKEAVKMHANGIRLKVVGDLSRFDQKLQGMVANTERMTENNDKLTLTICANYGGKWDIMQAISRLMQRYPGQMEFTEEQLADQLALSYAPDPDLFIRTGGEQRISNFLLWQLAYAELYFTDTYWPDFDIAALDAAIASYQRRERRFGRTSEQVKARVKSS